MGGGGPSDGTPDGQLGEDVDGLSGRGVAGRALRLGFAADADGALHAEEVVAAGHEGSDDLTFETHHALPGALPVPVRAAGIGGGA